MFTIVCSLRYGKEGCYAFGLWLAVEALTLVDPYVDVKFVSSLAFVGLAKAYIQYTNGATVQPGTEARTTSSCVYRTQKIGPGSIIL